MVSCDHIDQVFCLCLNSQDFDLFIEGQGWTGGSDSVETYKRGTSLLEDLHREIESAMNLAYNGPQVSVLSVNYC